MIEVGNRSRRRIVVDDTRAITFMGPDLRVYGTPNLLNDCEVACRDLLKTTLEPGLDSVGATVELKHSGAAVIGSTVEIDVVITGADGRHVSFEAVARCRGSVNGTVRHQRTVVDIERLKLRVRELSNRLSEPSGAES